MAGSPRGSRARLDFTAQLSLQPALSYGMKHFPGAGSRPYYGIAVGLMGLRAQTEQGGRKLVRASLAMPSRLWKTTHLVMYAKTTYSSGCELFPSPFYIQKTCPVLQ